MDRVASSCGRSRPHDISNLVSSIELRQYRIDDDTDPSDRMIGRGQVPRCSTSSTSPTKDQASKNAPVRFDPDVERQHLSRVSAPCEALNRGALLHLPAGCAVCAHQER